MSWCELFLGAGAPCSTNSNSSGLRGVTAFLIHYTIHYARPFVVRTLNSGSPIDGEEGRFLP